MTATWPTEVELKYRVIDPETADRLLAADRLGTFEAAGASRTTQHEDRYVDTADGALAKAGFAARLRRSGRQTIISVKGLPGGDGPLHRRDELEGPADRAQPPHDWPASAARSLVLELAGDAMLVELVTLRQLRRRRRYVLGDTELELSIDTVDVVDRGRIVDRFAELEVELVDGDADRLSELAVALAVEGGLIPATESKFTVALAAAGIAPARMASGASTDGRGSASHTGSSSRTGRSGRSKTRPNRLAPVPVGPGPNADDPGESGVAGSDDPTQVDDAAGLVTEPSAPVEANPPGTSSVPSGRAAASAPSTPVDAMDPADASAPNEPDAAADAVEPSPTLIVGKTPGVRAEDTLAEAGRKVLRFHLARMLAREPGTRSGEDPEDLHSMRVATRRMRAAWRVFGDAYRPGRTRRYRRDLRDVAARLGAVRDLDVLIAGLDGYAEALPTRERAGLTPLVSMWRSSRDEARDLLLRTLDSAAYERFVEEYREFVRTDGLAVLPVGPTSPHRVRDRMPSRIWSAYEQVRAYEPVLRWADVETLHDLRIAGKWLRYTVEFVREPLGPEAGPLIERVVGLQDHLGLLHDADVAAALARTFLVERAGELSESESAAIGRYLVDRERELARLRRTVGTPWRRVAGLTFRRALGRAIAGL